MSHLWKILIDNHSNTNMDFRYAPMFQLGEDKTEYYKIPGSEAYVSTGEF